MPRTASCHIFEALSPLYSATLPVSLIMDSEQLRGHSADSWLPLKNASQNEMRMDHYRATWIHSEVEFQKHWSWWASSSDRNLLAWFHYCNFRPRSVCNIVRFPEQSHFAVQEPGTSVLAAVHWCYSTRQWIPTLLHTNRSACNDWRPKACRHSWWPKCSKVTTTPAL